MTQKEKAKAYDEALKRAKSAIKNCGDNKGRIAMIESIFPELAESEDEKIRKALIRFHKSTIDIDGIKGADILAWLEKQCYTKKDVDDAYLKGIIDAKNELEKQGEQKPDDKVEPKFHKGEWIVWKNKCYKVNYNGCGYELIDQNGLSTSLEYGTVDENAHLWDITKDAKDGDVLISQYGNPLIYNGNYNSLYIGAYCGITCDDNKFKVAEEKCHWTENVDIKPATKEQRDTLMEAMADAGYTFDFEKKELKKIEQNPAWSEEDENYLQSAENACEYQYGKNTSTILWLKSLKDRVQPQPKQEWSEEDEKIALSIEQVMNCASLLNLVPEKIEKVRAWLKSIKERVQPQQNPTWSDEDEENLQHCCMAISVDSLHTHEDKQDMEAWLKRLKDRMGG